jgi:phosphoribosylglycinamide formyltransferase-1
MRIVGKRIIMRFRERIINIHPSLLPAFPGLEAQKQALEYGVKISGCTVHLVDEGMDTGPIILQASCPVEDEDTVESLSERILQYEHQIYPQAVKLFLEDKLNVIGRRVFIKKE